MANWRLDEGLMTLDVEWKKVHPDAVVYHIGDSKHSQNPEVSQHAPDDGSSGKPGDDKGEVDASDFMEGNGVTDADLDELFEGLVNSRDPRLLYIIRNRVIVSSVTQPWVRRAYTGSDPHTNHVHLSVNDNYDKNTADWKWEPAVAQNWTMKDLPKAKLPAELKFGQEDAGFNGYNAISRLQVITNFLERSLPALDPDGVYGANTARKVGKLLKTDGKKITAEQLAGFYGITGY